MVRKLLSVGIILVLSLPVLGQKRKLSSNRTAYTNETIDLNLKRLPQKYLGNNPWQLIEKLRQIYDKGDFETTEAYKARLKKEIDQNKIFAFVSSADECPFSYDADKQVWTHNCKYEYLDRIPLASTEKYVGSYPASNAFGVKVRVRSYKSERIEIASLSKNISHTIWSLQQPPEIAVKYRDRLRLLTIAKLGLFQEKDYLNIFTHKSKPSITYPSEVSQTNYAIYMELVAIWVFDSATGEILLKYDHFERQTT